MSDTFNKLHPRDLQELRDEMMRDPHRNPLPRYKPTPSAINEQAVRFAARKEVEVAQDDVPEVAQSFKDLPTTRGSRWIPAFQGGRITLDYVYVGGKRLAIPSPRTTKYLKVYLDGVSAPVWVEAMPETQDADSEVIDVTKNRLHFHGNFGR